MATKSIMCEAWGLAGEALRRECELAELPYVIEINGWGELEATPTGLRHVRLRGRIAAELARQLLHGEVLNGVPVLTRIGVRVPAVAWASFAFMRVHGGSSPVRRAPEICVEIVPEKDLGVQTRDRVSAFLAAGAKEVWIVFSDGRISYLSRQGERSNSSYRVSVSLPAPLLAN